MYQQAFFKDINIVHFKELTADVPSLTTDKLRKINAILEASQLELEISIDKLVEIFIHLLRNKGSFTSESVDQFKNSLFDALTTVCIKDERMKTLMGYVFNEHLSQSYKDEPHRVVEVYGEKIYRPNHGLAHTLRKLNYIDEVLDYLSKFSASDDAKNYYISIINDKDKYFNLCVLVAFLVAGREGETSFNRNKEQYLVYKKQSGDFTKSFLEKYFTQYDNINFYAELVENIGNPQYLENKKNNTEAYCLYQVCKFIHNLDLLRCCDANRYQREIAIYGLMDSSDIVVSSPQQRQAFDELTSLVEYMVVNTGDKQESGFINGNIQPKGKEYNLEEFYLFSCNPFLSQFLMKRKLAEYKNDYKESINYERTKSYR